MSPSAAERATVSPVIRFKAAMWQLGRKESCDCLAELRERQACLSAQRGGVQLPSLTLGGGVASRTASSPVDREPLGGVAGEDQGEMVPKTSKQKSVCSISKLKGEKGLSVIKNKYLRLVKCLLNFFTEVKIIKGTKCYGMFLSFVFVLFFVINL